jgi:hypothetical protein
MGAWHLQILWYIFQKLPYSKWNIKHPQFQIPNTSPGHLSSQQQLFYEENKESRKQIKYFLNDL